jgi:DNA invertase Pin-like site-specific DNA recombinase
MSGLAAAKKRGKRGGRPRVISTEKMTAIKEALDGFVSLPLINREIALDSRG